MLTFCEADLFMRAGNDVRFDTWPSGDFVRRNDGVPRDIPGYTITSWIPGVAELTETKWSIA